VPKSGKLIEFPRKVEWEQIHGWMAHVPGHPGLVAQVIWRNNRYSWRTFFQGIPLGPGGSDEDPDKAKEAALRNLEENTMVIRPLPRG
jgi:hypothetical protein